MQALKVTYVILAPVFHRNCLDSFILKVSLGCSALKIDNFLSTYTCTHMQTHTQFYMVALQIG